VTEQRRIERRRRSFDSTQLRLHLRACRESACTAPRRRRPERSTPASGKERAALTAIVWPSCSRCHKQHDRLHDFVSEAFVYFMDDVLHRTAKRDVADESCSTAAALACRFGDTFRSWRARSVRS